MGLMAKPGQFDFRFPDVLIDTGLIIDIPRGKDTRDSQLERQAQFRSDLVPSLKSVNSRGPAPKTPF